MIPVRSGMDKFISNLVSCVIDSGLIKRLIEVRELASDQDLVPISYLRNRASGCRSRLTAEALDVWKSCGRDSTYR